MPVKATFLITCLDENDKAACARIRNLLHDCSVVDAKPTAAYNHSGTREFASIDDALARMRELTRLAGKDAISVRVRVPHNERS